MSDSILRRGEDWVEDSPLSVRAKNALTKKGVMTIRECASLTEKQLLKVKNLGKKTVGEILKYVLTLNPEKENAPQGQSGKEGISVAQAEKDCEYLKLALAIPISKVFFSVRAKNILDGLEVKCLKDLVVLTEKKYLNERIAAKRL
jgi:DNA-directed RNA polymerase alpha subunit